jgi:two-component system NtrC family sensor kinase
MVKRLREADVRRAKMFHSIEYTNKMATIGRMAAGVAHEINNPLAIINEKAGLIKDIISLDVEFPHREKIAKLTDSVLNSVDRCSKVTHRLLGFARRMDARKELIEVRSLLEEVVSFQTTEAAHRNISINYHLPEDIPSIESDRGQLQQVFLNIINNAIAAVPDGGRIDIVVPASVDNNVSVMIKDNGSGIPEENLRHIFEPFFSTKGEFGTGLGLSITQDIVTNLGGRIEVRSKVGEGTAVTVTLPRNRVEYGG